MGKQTLASLAQYYASKGPHATLAAKISDIRENLAMSIARSV